MTHWRHRRHLIGGGLLVALVTAAALLSLVWTPFNPTAIAIRQRLRAPGGDHWLGTDQLGRDLLSMLLTGAQSSLLVGVLAVALGLVIGVALGLLASARRGWAEEIILRLTDFAFAFPAILTAIMLATLLGPGLPTAVLAIGLFNIPIFARVTRASANAIWARGYVQAARACGKTRTAITLRHVLPNIAAPLIVQATIQFATAILAEAALSYLGLGTQPPQPSWGRMLAEAQTLAGQHPHLAIFPGLAIAVAVLGFNLLGDGLRDAIDPRLSRRR